MYNNPFVEYLNSMHQLDANNENAFAESQANSEYYQKVKVERPIGNLLLEILETDAPQTIVLTGHAGDGKTSILLQILSHLAPNYSLDTTGSVDFSNGKRLFYIKDFSEISHTKRSELLRQSLEYSRGGGYSILVANTGVLTQAFKAIFGISGENLLIDMLDNGSGSMERFGTNSEYNVRVVNIANLDNSNFIEPYLKNLCSSELWNVCSGCPKLRSCPVRFNVEMVSSNMERVVDFITKHYTYQQEYGNRMTIRNVSAHLSFSITGGLGCDKVKSNSMPNYLFEYLFSNNFFGYQGFVTNKKALEIKAINETYKCNYEVNRVYADETLFINRDYSKLPTKLQNIVTYLEHDHINSVEFEYAIKRMYYLFNLETDPELNQRLTQELFSKYFDTWLAIKAGQKNLKKQGKLIFEVLNVLFTGSTKSSNYIPVTMKRESTIFQNVQYMYGRIDKRDIALKLEECGLKGCESVSLYLYIKDNKIHYPITLPLMDYFNDLLDGAITTDINPLLTQGIDSIKSQCIAYCKPSTDDDESFSLKILHNNKELEFSRDGYSFEIDVQ